MKDFIGYFFTDIIRIFKILRPNLRFRTVCLFLLMVLQSLLEVGFIITITYLGMALTDAAALNQTYLFKILFRLSSSLRHWAENGHNLLVLSSIVVVVLAALKNAVNYFTAKATALLGEDISSDIGLEIMQRFLYNNYAWHLSSESGDMFQRMAWRGNLAFQLSNLLSMYACVLTLVILFFSLAAQEPVLTTLVLGITGSVGLLLYKSIKKHLDSCAELSAKSSATETKALLCATKGIREVLIYRQQPVFFRTHAESVNQGRKPRTFLYVAPTLPSWVLEATGFAVVVASLMYLVYVQQATTVRITTALGLLMLTAWRVLPYCNRVVSYQVSIRSLRPVSDPVLDLLETMRQTHSDPPPPPAENFCFDHEIKLEHVSFRYYGAKENSLNDISFTIKKGTRVGVIGPSGAGKSTLVGVLSGLLPPLEGSISVDGIPLDAARSAAFASRIGYVPQSPFLFGGTLAENVAFSHWGAPWEEDKVHEACNKAAIDFIDSHPLGLLQPIGENGAGLSGGQAQRVSIARAMYSNPSLIIFDEATSSLDQANEYNIQQTIAHLASEVTCVIIAHRLTTVENCDMLIWIDKGKIVMQGDADTVLSAYKKTAQILPRNASA